MADHLDKARTLAHGADAYAGGLSETVWTEAEAAIAVGYALYLIEAGQDLAARSQLAFVADETRRRVRGSR